MARKLKRCEACDETFNWDDITIQVDDDYYHEECVELYPTGYCAFIGEEYLGETENDKGSLASSILSKNEYIDLDEQEEEQ